MTRFLLGFICAWLTAIFVARCDNQKVRGCLLLPPEPAAVILEPALPARDWMFQDHGTLDKPAHSPTTTKRPK